MPFLQLGVHLDLLPRLSPSALPSDSSQGAAAGEPAPSRSRADSSELPAALHLHQGCKGSRVVVEDKGCKVCGGACPLLRLPHQGEPDDLKPSVVISPP